MIRTIVVVICVAADGHVIGAMEHSREFVIIIVFYGLFLRWIFVANFGCQKDRNWYIIIFDSNCD